MQLLPVQVLLRLVSWVMVVCLSVNSVLAVISSYTGLDRLPFLARFWTASGSGESVAELAAGNGRFSGLFNQPAEAGVAYCLAAFCLVYLVSAGSAGSRATWLPCWVLVMLGGLMTQSKIFMVGGLAITVVLVLLARRERVVLALSAVVTVVGAIVVGTRGWLGDSGNVRDVRLVRRQHRRRRLLDLHNDLGPVRRRRGRGRVRADHHRDWRDCSSSPAGSSSSGNSSWTSTPCSGSAPVA